MEDFQCQSCSKIFDLEFNLPKLLINCGHSICSLCLNKLTLLEENNFKCKFDSVQYDPKDKYPDNLNMIGKL